MMTFLRSDKGLTLVTSDLETLQGGQFTLSIQLIKPNHLITMNTNFGEMNIKEINL